MIYTDKSNIFVLDVVRALCIIWIVMIWHVNDYLPIECQYKESVGCLQYITTAVLALFSLLSGLLLSKYKFDSLDDIKAFYKKRFSRFYVLFLIAVLLFYLLGIYNVKTSIECLSGVAVYVGEMPYTLWYMSMLMSFYLVTPILRCSKKTPRVVLTLILVAFMLMLHFVRDLDYRIIIYFLSYIIGLYTGESVIVWLKQHDFHPHTLIRASIEIIAYASFCMYLYHRVVFWTVGKLFGYADRSLGFSMSVWVIVVAIVLTILLSYYIQLAYDKLLNSSHRKK